MKIFRINIYLKLKILIKSIFSEDIIFKKIDKIILFQSKKKIFDLYQSVKNWIFINFKIFKIKI